MTRKNTTNSHDFDPSNVELVAGPPETDYEIDPAKKLDEITQVAIQDTAVRDVAGLAHGHPTLVDRIIDAWANRHRHYVVIAEQRDAELLAGVERGAAAHAAAAEVRAAARRADLDERHRRLDRMRELAGIEADPPDRGPRWRSRLGDWALYLAAAGAEVAFNTSAFQIMRSGPLETFMYAAAVVLISILLPKMIGHLIARLREGGRGPKIAAILGLGAMWVGTVTFVAAVRTAFLLAPAPSADGEAASSLGAQTNLDATVLTIGWIITVCAVGFAVMAHVVRRHWPTKLAAEQAGLFAVQQRLADETAELVLSQRAHRDVMQHRAGLATQYAVYRAAITALAVHMKAVFRRTLAQQARDPKITEMLEIRFPATEGAT
ncbi:hypothetical protein ACWEV3_01135 [Saccharopolyspora sp. NPDC003752]